MFKKIKISFIEVIYIASFIVIGLGVYYSTISPFKGVGKFDLNLISQIKTAKENATTTHEYSFTLITDKILNTYKTVYFKKFRLSKGLIVFVYFWSNDSNKMHLKKYLIYYDNKKRNYSWLSDDNATKFWFNKIYELKYFPTSIYIKDDYLYLELKNNTYKIILEDNGLDYDIL